MSCECTDHYYANVSCSNCNYSGGLNIKKGTKITEESCPNCGCKTLSPSMTITSTPWTYQPPITYYYDGTAKPVWPTTPPIVYCAQS